MKDAEQNRLKQLARTRGPVWCNETIGLLLTELSEQLQREESAKGQTPKTEQARS